MKIKDVFKISILYFVTFQCTSSELQDMIKSVYLRSQELKEMINNLEVVIANQSKIIQEQREQIANLEGKSFMRTLKSQNIEKKNKNFDNSISSTYQQKDNNWKLKGIRILVDTTLTGYRNQKPPFSSDLSRQVELKTASLADGIKMFLE